MLNCCTFLNIGVLILSSCLRDCFLENITITEQVIEQLNDFLKIRKDSTNEKLKVENANKNKYLTLSYVIRFDGRGYKLTDFSDLKKHYEHANTVERIIFTLSSNENTNNTCYELKVDAKNPNNSLIEVSSVDGDAVDSVFSGLLETINKGKNKNGFVRNTWTEFLVQILGLVFGFIISLIAGIQTAPHIQIENSFFITFLFVFLIFSNSWGFINQQILRFLYYSFPNINFSRQGKSSLHWLSQAFVGGIVVAITLIILGQSFNWLGSILGKYIGA
jgi:hypothetical protein